MSETMGPPRAPWTDEQVAALNAFQADRRVHPFTCPERGDDAHHRISVLAAKRDVGMLVATRDGWVCPVCGYTQDWAHDGMLRPRPPVNTP